MNTTQLEDEFISAIQNATEVWIAVALMNNKAYEDIKSKTPSYCKQHYIIGTDLPTTPEVLFKLMKQCKKGSFEAFLYNGNKVFHPKVYLFRRDSEYFAFIGSSNYTKGGMKNNIEFNYKITNQEHCREILTWFEQLKKDSAPLTAENIAEYAEGYNNLKPIRDQLRKTKKPLKLNSSEINPNYLGGINFSDRYFSKEHHLAFRRELHFDPSPEANRERKKVSDQLILLHKEIYDKFEAFGISELYPNKSNHIISLYYQLPDKPLRKLDGMWLSYGKNQQEIKKYQALFPKVAEDDDEDNLQSFINHARVQIKISLNEIGIWILFGKENGGSTFDRKYFRLKMEGKEFRESFHRQMIELPAEYWITVNNLEPRNFNSFDSPESLHDFCKADNDQTYFIIGRNYKISESEMSKQNLPITTLQEFKRLYPIYEFMRDTQFK